MIEVAFFLSDQDKPDEPRRGPDYHAMAKAMVHSLKAQTKDVYVTQLTDAKTLQVEGVDNVARFTEDVTPYNLMAARTVLYSKHVRHARAPLIYIDVDCLWIKPPSFPKENWDVGVLYRAGQPSMPYIASMIYTVPNERALDWWGHYAHITLSLPQRFHPWWCDQIGLALTIGIEHAPGNIVTSQKAKVGILDAYEHNLISEHIDTETKASLVHFKGRHRKDIFNAPTNAATNGDAGADAARPDAAGPNGAARNGHAAASASTEEAGAARPAA